MQRALVPLALALPIAALAPARAQSWTARELLPLQVGAQWTYDVRVDGLRRGTPARSTVVDENRCLLADGREVHQLRVATAGEPARFEAWAADEVGIARLLPRDALTRGAIDFDAAPLRWLAGPVRKGNTWQWQGGNDLAAADGRGWQHIATIVATDERIAVPAGSFAAVHVRVESSHEGTIQLTRELWFAPQVGLVREHHRDAELDLERALVSFAPGPDDRERRLREHLDRELANPRTPAWNNSPFVQWLDGGPELLLLQGSIAVVRTDAGAALYHVGPDTVRRFEAADNGTLGAVVRAEFGTETALPPVHVPAASLALLLARAEASRLGFARIEPVPVTLAPRRELPRDAHRTAAVEVKGGALDGTERRVAAWVALRRQSLVQVATDATPAPNRAR